MFGWKKKYKQLQGEFMEIQREKSRLLRLSLSLQMPKVEDRFEPMRQDELQTAFAVADDEPLLEAVIHVLHAMEIERADDAAASGLPAEISKGYSMAQGALKDAQEEILRWVDEANRTKRGEAAA